MDGVVDCGGDAVSADGEVDRVLGAFTAVESVVDAVVDKDALDPVPRRLKAANRGRGAAVELGVLEVPFVLFMLILAAS